MSLTELVNIASQTFGLPQFQRPPTWDWDHQRELLQSIFQKVPIGSIMIWQYNREKTPELEYRKLDEINQNKENISHLILDGQQRMRFLTLLWLSSTKDDTYCNQLKRNSGHIFFYPDGLINKNGEINNFVMSDRRDEKYNVTQKWVSLQYLLSNVQSKNNLKTYFETSPGEANSITQNLDQMYENFNSYRISYHNLGPDIDYATALLVYERVNLAGKRLSALDVSEAVYISKYPELFSKIKEKSIFYKSQGFGSDKSFSRKRILNNISVELYRSIASRPKELSVFKPKTRDGKALQKKHVKKAFDETIKAFDYLLGILKNEFSMTNDKPIITNYPLIVAASFIRKNNGKLNTVQKGKLCRWLAMSILTNRYAGKGTNTKMDEDLRIVYQKADPWDYLYANMRKIAKVGRKSFHKEDFGLFSTNDFVETKNSWLGQLYIAKMNWYNALDFISLQTISSVEKLEWHHIFPQVLWKNEKSALLKTKDLKENRDGYMNHFANKSYISKRSNGHIGGTEPLIYLTTIDTKRRQILEAHDLDDMRYFKQNEYKSFLERRLRKIVTSMNNWLDDLEKGGAVPVKTSIHTPDEIFNTNDHETQFVEWKETYLFATDSENYGKKLKILETNLMKEICGMANSGGGHIFIGVNDKGIPTGMDRDYSVISSKGTKDFEYLQGIIYSKITSNIVISSKPNFRFNKLIDITKFNSSGSEIVCIKVPHWPSEDVLFKSKISKNPIIWNGIKYVRDGAHKDPYESAKYSVNSDGLWVKMTN